MAKTLAGHLSAMIEDLVQTGFMPGKGTDLNARRLFLNLSLPHENTGTSVITSLDAEKAFNSVEWIYLREVMSRYGFGPRYLNWLRLLYRAPRAQVGTNARISEAFSLYHSTRQGCPLSPTLFALALEPLAILMGFL